MSRWFRVYDDLVDDPKVQRLPDALFKALVNLWCLASHNGGRLPALEDICFKLRIKPEKGAALIAGLKNVGLIDEDEDGYVPHNWNARQFKSDVSNERVKRHRERKCNVTDTVTVTPPDTEQIQNRAESEKKDIRAVADATRPDEHFDKFWKTYPKREGANPRVPARKKFLAAVKSGVPAEIIISAARRYSAECQSKQQIGTPYVAQAVTWLNQQRWGDYTPNIESENARNHMPPSPDLPSDDELRRKYGATNGRRDETAEPAKPADGERADNAGDVLREGAGNDRGDVPGERADDRTGKPGMRSVGEILQRIPGVAAVGITGGSERGDSPDDGSGTVAGVVRH